MRSLASVPRKPTREIFADCCAATFVPTPITTMIGRVERKFFIAPLGRSAECRALSTECFLISNSVLSTRYSVLLLDNSVRPHQQVWWDREADLLGGFEVDHKH